MRAYEIQNGFGLENLVAVERPDPVCGPGQVVVDLHALSLNYRDWLVLVGQYNPRMKLPRVPLSDGVGRVREVGSEVRSLRPGDRVAGCFFPHWVDGDMSDDKARDALGADSDGLLRTCAAFEEHSVTPVPEHLTDEQAATLPCAAVTAWNALFEQNRVVAGDTVLVQGTGGVSVFALQFAHLAGARVIATSSSDAKLERLKTLGADETINYVTTPKWEDAVRTLTGGVGVDTIVEVGGAGTLPRSFKAVRRGGHISLIGVLAGNASEVNPLPITMRNIRLQGILVGSRAMFTRMNRAIVQHHLVPVLDRTFAFNEARAALEYLKSGQHFGKVTIRVV